MSRHHEFLIGPSKLSLTQRAFAVLGAWDGGIVESSDGDGSFLIRAGGILASHVDGTELYRLMASVPERGPSADRFSKLDRVAGRRSQIEALSLREEWAGEDPEWAGVEIPAFQEPKFSGYLVLVRYRFDRDKGAAIWEHYFCDGEAPRYPEVWDLGNSQYWIAAAGYVADRRGIHDAKG